MHLKLQFLDQILDTFEQESGKIQGSEHQENLGSADSINDTIKDQLKARFSTIKRC